MNPTAIQGKKGKRLIVEADGEREGRTLLTVVSHRSGQAVLCNVPTSELNAAIESGEGSVSGHKGKTLTVSPVRANHETEGTIQTGLLTLSIAGRGGVSASIVVPQKQCQYAILSHGDDY